jgi:hypothetical protein
MNTRADSVAEYVRETFQGSAESLTTLSKGMQNGLMLSAAVADLSSVVMEAQHIMHAKMAPVAWSLAPVKYLPFIL